MASLGSLSLHIGKRFSHYTTENSTPVKKALTSSEYDYTDDSDSLSALRIQFTTYPPGIELGFL